MATESKPPIFKIDNDFIDSILNQYPDSKTIHISMNSTRYAESIDNIPWSFELNRDDLNYIEKCIKIKDGIQVILLISDKIQYHPIKCFVF